MPTVPIRRSDEEKPIRDVPREVTVTISIDANKNISVDPDPFWVIKSANQEVRWILADGDGDFLIDFNHDSPFYESQFGPDFPVSGLVDAVSSRTKTAATNTRCGSARRSLIRAVA